MIKSYTADFETTTDPNDCRVWAWGIMNINNINEKYTGNNIETFLMQVQDLCCCDMYFHNLRFDSQFIIYWLLTNGFTCVDGSNDLDPMQFSILMNGTNAMYSLKVCFKRFTDKKGRTVKKYVTFKDSLKKIPFGVGKIAEDFKLPISKLEIDYHEKRPKGHILTQQEEDYLNNDIEIMARALKIQFDQGLKKLTIGSDALTSFKQTCKEFDNYFPKLTREIDTFCRRAYHGGWCYVNPKFQCKDIGKGMVFDVNSLYPWALRYNEYPIGQPILYEGKYEEDEEYPLYIQRIRCLFKLRKGKFPIIQLKNCASFMATEYVVESDDEYDLTLCNVDLKLFLENYEVENMQYLGGYKFKKQGDIFNAYIDQWMYIKEHSEGAIRALAKLMLNNLYGKFSTNPHIIEKQPIIEDGAVKYIVSDEYFGEGVYIPVGLFCTAYAREKTIRTAQKVYDRFIYADTDSLHITGTEVPKAIEHDVHPTHLGMWKLESTFNRARFLKAKTYIEENEELEVKCAGMPQPVKDKVTWDNFKVGFKEYGKLVPVNVEGGVVLEDRAFTIKNFKMNKPIA